jgi:hypothetical protein
MMRMKGENEKEMPKFRHESEGEEASPRKK